MFMQKNKENGITMITLAVTIIVLIILAGVSINMLVGDNGIITQAQQARENIELAQVEEQTSLNQLYEEMEQEGIYTEDEESIQKDEMIKSLQEQLEEQSKEIEELKKQLQIYKLKEGDYIQYDTGVEGVGEITCRVLYTASSKYGLQIIADEGVETVSLGVENNFEASKTSYNNAIETLNHEAEKYINATYATDARCVGSVPMVENGVFINKNLETAGPVTMQFEYNGSTSIDAKGEDTNYTVDEEQMRSFNLLVTGYEYWLSSRYIFSNSTGCGLNIRRITTSGSLFYGDMCSIYYTGEAVGRGYGFALRPCILLRDDIEIIGGDGSEEKPYIIG